MSRGSTGSMRTKGRTSASGAPAKCPSSSITPGSMTPTSSQWPWRFSKWDDIRVIAHRMKKYLTLFLGKYRVFIDRLQFLGSILPNLPKNLLKRGLDSYNHLCKKFHIFCCNSSVCLKAKGCTWTSIWRAREDGWRAARTQGNIVLVVDGHPHFPRGFRARPEGLGHLPPRHDVLVSQSHHDEYVMPFPSQLLIRY